MRVTTIRTPNNETRKLIMDTTVVIFNGYLAFENGTYKLYDKLKWIDEDTIFVDDRVIITKSKIVDMRGYD